jgi:hypothetical protein
LSISSEIILINKLFSNENNCYYVNSSNYQQYLIVVTLIRNLTGKQYFAEVRKLSSHAEMLIRCQERQLASENENAASTAGTFVLF